MRLALLVALLLGATSFLSAYAADAAIGQVELNLLESIFTGNIGLTIGLAIAALGIIAVVNGDTKGGIILVILGVLITLLPGFFNGLRLIACPLAESLGGHCGNS